MKKYVQPQCSICGKFVGHKTTDLVVDITPDTDYTEEDIVYTHKKCIRNEMGKL
jgi:hypothetical protein